MIKQTIIHKYLKIHLILFVAFFIFSTIARFDEFRTSFGGVYRFYSDWGFTACLFSAFFIFFPKRHELSLSIISSMASLYTVLFVILFFVDPGGILVAPIGMMSDGISTGAFITLTIHSVVPVLQVANTLFLANSFQRLRPIIYAMLLIEVIYILWIELLVAPLNNSPIGSITTGLPYPLLNNLPLIERIEVYGIITLLTVLTVLILFGLRKLIVRFT